MFSEKPKDFSSNAVDTKPIINTKDRWLEFASRLFHCSYGEKSKEEIIAYLEFIQDLIDSAMAFIPVQNWNKWKLVRQNISLEIKHIANQQELISVNYGYCTNIIAGLEYEVRFTQVAQKYQASEKNEIIRAKENLIAQINEILSSGPDETLISKGLALLRESFWLLNNDIKDQWEQIIANIGGRIRYINIMTKNEPDFHYEEEISNLCEIVKNVLSELIRALE